METPTTAARGPEGALCGPGVIVKSQAGMVFVDRTGGD